MILKPIIWHLNGINTILHSNTVNQIKFCLFVIFKLYCLFNYHNVCFVCIALLVWYDARAHHTHVECNHFNWNGSECWCWWIPNTCTYTHAHSFMENVNGECIICVKLHETIGANICSSVKSDNVSITLTRKKKSSKLFSTALWSKSDGMHSTVFINRLERLTQYWCWISSTHANQQKNGIPECEPFCLFLLWPHKHSCVCERRSLKSHSASQQIDYGKGQ